MQLLQTRVTQMELRERPALRVAPPVSLGELRLMPAPRIALSFYRYLYESVGRAHHWTSRLLPDEFLAREIHTPAVTVHVLYVDGSPAGWFELDGGRNPGEMRIVHFGVMPAYRGLGIARYLLSEAIDAAFDASPAVVTLETNTLDNPAAKRLYREAGFIAVSVRLVSTRAIED